MTAKAVRLVRGRSVVLLSTPVLSAHRGQEQGHYRRLPWLRRVLPHYRYPLAAGQAGCWLVGLAAGMQPRVTPDELMAVQAAQRCPQETVGGWSRCCDWMVVPGARQSWRRSMLVWGV